MTCNASIVLYHTPEAEVKHIEELLRKSGVISHVRMIDNALPGANIGYGAAHNIALRESIEQGADYHLVLNSDIDFAPEHIRTLLNYMHAHEDVALIQPKIYYGDGTLQRNCKRLPTPLNVFGRRFLPKSWMRKCNARYEMHETGYDHTMNVPYLSGCFMLLRISALKEVGLFDERFFMYPEDIDLTRRLHQRYKTLFYPEVSITHNHQKASYHSAKMLWIHCINMLRYFNKWGWIWDQERTRLNKVEHNLSDACRNNDKVCQQPASAR